MWILNIIVTPNIKYTIFYHFWGETKLFDHVTTKSLSCDYKLPVIELLACLLSRLTVLKPAFCDLGSFSFTRNMPISVYIQTWKSIVYENYITMSVDENFYNLLGPAKSYCLDIYKLKTLKRSARIEMIESGRAKDLLKVWLRRLVFSIWRVYFLVN